MQIAALEENNRELNSRLAGIAALATSAARAPIEAAMDAEPGPKIPGANPTRPEPVVTFHSPVASGNSMHPAGRKLLIALAQHARARFT